MDAFNKAIKQGINEILLNQRTYDNTGKLINKTVRGGDASIKVGAQMNTNGPTISIPLRLDVR